MNVILGPRARTDLLAIWNWIARDDPQAATNMLRRFEKAILLIGEFPEMGRARPEIGLMRVRTSSAAI